MASKQNKNESSIVSETCEYMANYVKERSDEGFTNYLVFNLNNDDVEDELFEALRIDGDTEILDLESFNRRIFENFADYAEYAWWENETDALDPELLPAVTTLATQELKEQEKRLTEAENTLKKAQEEIEKLKAENEKIREQNDRFFAKIQEGDKAKDELKQLKDIFRRLVRED